MPFVIGYWLFVIALAIGYWLLRVSLIECGTAALQSNHQ